MAKRISQETFDAVVQENVEDFEMELEEAVADAIEQFQLQGVDLSNIVTTGGPKDDHPVLVALNAIKAATEGDDDEEESKGVLESLAALREAVGDEKENKTIAGTRGALEAVGGLVASYNGDVPAMIAICSTVAALISKHGENRKRVPADFLKTVAELVAGSAADLDPKLLRASLRVLYQAAIKEDAHKQISYSSGACAAIVGILKAHSGSVLVLKEALSLVRSVITNDDRDCAMSKAFDYARELNEAGMALAVVALLGEQGGHAGLVTDSFLLLRALCVNNTIATELVEAGVLGLLVSTCSALVDNARVAAAGCALARALAGNDDNKKVMGAAGSPSLGVLLQVFQRHIEEAKVVQEACGALAALTLRSPENAGVVVEAGAPTLLAKAMRLHVKSVAVCKQACLATRNIVSRNTEVRPKMMLENIDKLLRVIRDSVPAARDNARAALRDMGLEFDVVEDHPEGDRDEKK